MGRPPYSKAPAKPGAQRKQISPAARYGVWYAWAGCCFWCREPIVYQHCEIDHVIPLEAVSSIGAEKLRTRFALPSDFEFDNFSNWVPAHAGCNRRKGKSVLDASPELLLHLRQVQMMAPVAQGTVKKFATTERVRVP